MAELAAANAVLLERHFVYKSGKHGSGYINMDPVLPNVRVVQSLAESLVSPFIRTGIETVAAPATGAIVLSVLGALHVTSVPEAWDVAAVWADQDGDQFVFGRDGFTAHLANKRVLVVEDLLTTGGSVYKVCREAEKHGAKIVGVSVVCNRGGVTADQLGVPRLESLASVNFEAASPDDCELCRTSVPIVEDIGHGDKYKSNHPDYPGGYIKLRS